MRVGSEFRGAADGHDLAVVGEAGLLLLQHQVGKVKGWGGCKGGGGCKGKAARGREERDSTHQHIAV